MTGRAASATSPLNRNWLALLLAGTLALGGCAAPSAASAAGGQDSEAATSEAAATETAPAADASPAAALSPADATMSYLGPEGTYTQEACARFFDGAGTYLPTETVADAVQMLVDGQSDYAVIPQENTIGGPVIDYVDVLLDTPSVHVIGEIELPISQNLLVQPGTKLEDVTTVYSHKQGIAQGKAWLEENLPDAGVLEVSSTAEGARLVADGEDEGLAAICSAGCAEVYGLEVLAADIQQNDSNKTRFYVLAAGEPTQEAGEDAADRTAFVAEGSARDLPALLAAVEAQGMEVVAVHDRPQKTELGNYRFVVECTGGSAAAFAEVSKVEGFAFRYLGSFPVR